MLPARRLQQRRSQPLALHDRAADDLRFIRKTMERSASFTAVSGLGVLAMGVVALVAAVVVRGAGPERWVATWLAAAALAFVTSLSATALKARRIGEPVLRGPGRKFVLAVLPSLAAGALLTLPLLDAGAVAYLPGLWLLLYGGAVLAGGAFSVRIVPIMGGAFMALGAVATLVPTWGGELMVAGFGGLHLVFGTLIAWRHGG